MLKLNHVTVNRGSQMILNDISAELHAQRITTLIGPNGAGKTTLLKLITKELMPNAGTVTGLPSKLALLAQHNELFEPLTVRELFALTNEPLDNDIIARLGLTALLDQPMPTLSGGQQQLAWLGFVLQQQPSLIILDEPTTYLDLQYQQLFLETLQELQDERQFTVLMVLHDLTQAFAYSDQIWLLNKAGQLTSGDATTMANVDELSATFNTALQLVTVDDKRFFITK